MIDDTGLHGYYDFALAYAPAKDEFPMRMVEASLGMKFVLRLMAVETYIIQSAARPSID